MTSEFKKILSNNETRYVLESASVGATSSGSVASVSAPLGKVRKRSDNILAQETDDDPCWKNYKQLGMKKKNGKSVPNCVPKEGIEESAPPGFPEDLMMKLKKQYPGNPERAFATAWSIHKKKKKSVKEDPYFEELSNALEAKLKPNDPVDVWKQDFQTADPNRYHQFKNKTPEKKDQMAISAHYKARQPIATKK